MDSNSNKFPYHDVIVITSCNFFHPLSPFVFSVGGYSRQPYTAKAPLWAINGIDQPFTKCLNWHKSHYHQNQSIDCRLHWSYDICNIITAIGKRCHFSLLMRFTKTVVLIWKIETYVTLIVCVRAPEVAYICWDPNWIHQTDINFVIHLANSWWFCLLRKSI